MATKAKKHKGAEAELEAIRAQIRETTRELEEDVADELKKADAVIGELRIRAEDSAIEGGPAIDYGAIRKAGDEKRGLQTKRAHLELKLAVLTNEEAKGEILVLEEQIQVLRPQIADVRAELRRLGGPGVEFPPLPEGELGSLVGEAAAAEGRRAQLWSENVSRQNRMADARVRLDAIMEGKPDPGSSVRFDHRGRVVDTAVRVGGW